MVRGDATRKMLLMACIVETIPYGADVYYVWRDAEGRFGVTKNNMFDPPNCAYASIAALRKTKGI